MAENARKAQVLSIFMLVLILMLGALPVLGASAIVGSVAAGTNATIGEVPLVPHTTVFSGDSLQVRDGAAIVALPRGSLVVLGRESAASFDRAPDEVTVALSRGSVSMFHPADGMPLRVKVGSVSILSGHGFKTQGDVAMVNGIIVVTAKEGSLAVEGAGRTVEVKKGKTIAIKNVSSRSPSGQVGAGGGGANISMHLLVPIAIAGAAGATAGVMAAAHSKNGTNEDKLNSAAAAAAAAQAANASAQSAAAAAAAASTAACKAASPSNPVCTSH